MIYNVPPICKKPFIVFDGVVRGNGETYGNVEFTNTFKWQVKEGVTPRKIIAGYAPGTGWACIGQFPGYVQLDGVGASTGDGSEYYPWGIYISTPVKLGGKKKLTINAANSYYKPSGVALTNEQPIRACLFHNIYDNMFINNVRSVEVPSCPACSDGSFEAGDELIIPEPEEIILDVSDLSGEYYIGFTADHSKTNIVIYHYLNIGEIVAF